MDLKKFIQSSSPPAGSTAPSPRKPNKVLRLGGQHRSPGGLPGKTRCALKLLHEAGCDDEGTAFVLHLDALAGLRLHDEVLLRFGPKLHQFALLDQPPDCRKGLTNIRHLELQADNVATAPER